MKDENLFCLKASSYPELISNRRVFNLGEVNDILEVCFPHGIKSIYEITHISNPEYEVDISIYIKPTCSCWKQIMKEGLCLTPGQHDYRVKYYDSVIRTTRYMYFGYIIQDNNPDKPYVYMSR